MELNKYQLEAVRHKDGPAVVVSVAGSGKTSVIVERIIYLLEEGIPEKNLLCITFTNKAANEMKERICARLEKNKINFFIGTFHALCASILRKFGSHIGLKDNFTIIDDREQFDMMNQVFKYIGNQGKVNKKDVWSAIGCLNNKKDNAMELTIDNDSKLDVLTKKRLNNYIKRCENHGLVDFSGLIYETIRLLETVPEVREKLQNIFKYIMVDEAQDTNVSQYRLVTLLGGKWKNIMLVGDPDQSIYKWRNARYQNVLDFIDNYENCRVLYLGQNYRSTPDILAKASQLIKKNPNRLDVNFETDKQNGQPVSCNCYSDNRDEANRIANKILDLINNEGWSTEDMAILYRANHMSEPIEQALTAKSISYKVIGGYSFYDRLEIRECLALLKFLTNKRDCLAFHRVASLIKGIGTTTIKKIEELSLQDDINLLEATRFVKDDTNRKSVTSGCEKLLKIYGQNWDFSEVSGNLTKLIEEFDIEGHLSGMDNGYDRINNVHQMIDASSMYDGKGGVSKYLQQISLMSSTDKSSDGNVSLMTLHSAKGLEWPIVFLIGLNEGIFPHNLSILGGEEEIYEERRLLYVGITRAQSHLYMSWYTTKNVYKGSSIVRVKCKPSRFLADLGYVKEEKIVLHHM